VLKRALAVFSLALAAFGAQATTVIPLFMDEIIDGSAVAFQGTVTANRSERDAKGFVVTYTTFSVTDVLKGQVASSYTIKQIGGSLPAENLSYKVQGVPTFSMGQSYVVFLPGVSALGFSSPVGLSQGRFNIAAGEVSNGRDFGELMSRMAPGANARAPQGNGNANGRQNRLNLDDFKNAIRQHVGGGQ
jgi:hypothetical protein